MLDKWDLCYVIYMFLSNNPSSGDINSSDLPCFFFCIGYTPENFKRKQTPAVHNIF